MHQFDISANDLSRRDISSDKQKCMIILENKNLCSCTETFSLSVNMKIASLIFLAFCLLCTAADSNSDDFRFTKKGKSDINTRIVGGKNAEEGQFPYQVSLRNRFLRGHFCGASILTSRFMLTAGHCTQGLNSKPLFIYAVVGTISLKSGVSINFNKITPHEGFSLERIENDISLLRTATEITFTNFIQPIALPSRNLPEEGNIAVILSGWGQTAVSYN